MKNGGGHFAPELGGHFELESGAQFLQILHKMVCNISHYSKAKIILRLNQKS